jgi:hypothetical protein
LRNKFTEAASLSSTAGGGGSSERAMADAPDFETAPRGVRGTRANAPGGRVARPIDAADGRDSMRSRDDRGARVPSRVAKR